MSHRDHWVFRWAPPSTESRTERNSRQLTAFLVAGYGFDFSGSKSPLLECIYLESSTGILQRKCPGDDASVTSIGEMSQGRWTLQEWSLNQPFIPQCVGISKVLAIVSWTEIRNTYLRCDSQTVTTRILFCSWYEPDRVESVVSSWALFFDKYILDRSTYTMFQTKNQIGLGSLRLL